MNGGGSTTYKNHMNTYLDEFVITRFDSGIVFKGQYTFPFVFYLPPNMSGSFNMYGDNYIQYPLTVLLLNSKDKKKVQESSTLLNIR